MPLNTLQSASFSQDELVKHLDRGNAVDYLAGYLGDLGATAVLYESHYIDRHYLDEFVHYYARSFNPPSSACGRLHFFAGLSPTDIEHVLTRAYQGTDARTKAENELQPHYLGFVVRRPLPGARVGRTVLKTYAIEGRRHYKAVRPYKVNFVGLRLSVMGLAYQQQDGGAAVCASTALWSALQRVAYVAGDRTPTPTAITAAAQSPFPVSDGLLSHQMATAITYLGYSVDHIVSEANHLLFRAIVCTYLRSQLPVVLLLKRTSSSSTNASTVGHALTLTGFSEPREIVTVSPPDAPRAARMRDGSLNVVYVHDDNLGSHAHYELRQGPADGSGESSRLVLLRGRSDEQPKHKWWSADEWTVLSALVPKPTKMRMPIRSLFSALKWLVPNLEEDVFDGVEVDYTLEMTSGVDYKRELFDFGFSADRLRWFVASLALPRYIGIIRVNIVDVHLCDLIVDVSEVPRQPEHPSVLAIVARGLRWGAPAQRRLAHFATKHFNAPIISMDKIV